MFKKLLSNLPFNPALITEVAFYSNRIRSEAAVRKLGLVFIALSMVVQMFAFLSPTEPTLAASSNDVIYAGFSNRDEATLHCLGDTQGFRDVLAYYGVDCDIISRAETVTLNSRAHNSQLDSMGRNPVAATNPKNGKESNMYPVQIGGTTFYMKNLWYWDTWSSSDYKALKMTNKHGQVIYVLYSCGNIVTIGKYEPPKPPAPTPTPTPTPTPQEEPEPTPTPEPVDVCPNIPDLQTSYAQCDVCPNIPGEQSSADECYPCPEAEDNGAEACLGFDKQARNDTQAIADANGTEADAGDVIEYTLSVKNTGSVAFVDFRMQENMNDVLEYADILDMDGGELDEDEGIVSWTAADIAAGATLQKKITVQVKEEIPQTPSSTSDPGSYDLIMTNVFYDKTIHISLPAGPEKQIEIVSKTLPNTGPGEGIAAAFVILAVSGYFFARSRLMTEELDIIKHEYSAGA